MKVSPECYQCLERLIHQTVEFSTSDSELRSKALDQALGILKQSFTSDKVPAEIASNTQRVIRAITGNPDPYRQMKDRELEAAKDLLPEACSYYGQDIEACLKLAVLGNSIDFFRVLDEVKQDVKRPIQLAIDDTSKVKERLKEANKVLYLPDNAGECFFDIPLIRKIEEGAEVTYAVKDSPVQDDITHQDLKIAGLENEIKRVITTGTDTAGIDFSQASTEFRQEFDSADVILAKGMGYYETLSELPIYGRTIYCLMAKCKPIANSLGVPLNSYIVMLQ